MKDPTQSLLNPHVMESLQVSSSKLMEKSRERSSTLLRPNSPNVYNSVNSEKNALSVDETRQILTESRREGVDIEKIIKMPNGTENAIDVLTTFNILDVDKYRSARVDIDSALDGGNEDKIVNLKGIKGMITNNSRNRYAKANPKYSQKTKRHLRKRLDTKKQKAAV